MMEEIIESNGLPTLNPFLHDRNYELFPARRKKILVIDDDQDFRLTISEMLVDEGFSVATAKDGEVALNQLLHQVDPPDLILVDLMMPVMGGMEFRREQLLSETIAHIPVLFVSGQGYVDGERCLLKPLDSREFIERVRKLLQLI